MKCDLTYVQCSCNSKVWRFMAEFLFYCAINWFFFLTVYLWENCSKNNISWNNLAFFWDFLCSLAPSRHAICCVEFEFKPFWAVTLSLCDISKSVLICGSKLVRFFCSIENLMARRWLGVGVTIPCLYLQSISSLLAICFLFSSNPLLPFLLLSTSLYYSAFLLLSFSLFSLLLFSLILLSLFIIHLYYSATFLLV